MKEAEKRRAGGPNNIKVDTRMHYFERQKSN
jgi:hypothetical protein